MINLCLTKEELQEVTGLKRFASQFKWLSQQGFIVRQRGDGMPIVSRQHFETMMGGLFSSSKSKSQQPDFSSLS
jgi:uncharacterized protein DUF4224